MGFLIDDSIELLSNHQDYDQVSRNIEVFQASHRDLSDIPKSFFPNLLTTITGSPIPEHVPLSSIDVLIMTLCNMKVRHFLIDVLITYGGHIESFFLVASLPFKQSKTRPNP